jgi:hypothetical protein
MAVCVVRVWVVGVAVFPEGLLNCQNKSQIMENFDLV